MQVVSRSPTVLLVIVSLTIVTIGVNLLSPVPSNVAQSLLALPFLFLFPGYVLVRTLFPRVDEVGADEGGSSRGRIDGFLATSGQTRVERVVLSIPASILVSGVIGMLLAYTPWGLRSDTFVLSNGAFTLSFALFACYRAQTRSDTTTGATASRPGYRDQLRGYFAGDRPIHTILTGIVIVSLLASLVAVGYAIAIPQRAETPTELYLLTENESGELVAANYPTEFTAGENRTVHVGITNREFRTTTFNVVVLLEAVESDRRSADGSGARQLRRFTPTIEPGETWQERHVISPEMTGTDLRLSYLLYKGPVPDDPSIGSAYREVHLWITVTPRDEPR